VTTAQGIAAFQTADGNTTAFDFVDMVTLTEEDGELKVLNCKTFIDAEKLRAVIASAAKAPAQGSTVT
jgi:hypothetical protein